MTNHRRTAIIIPILFLIIAVLFNGLPYGFFTLLRLIVCISALYLAWTIRGGGKHWVAAVFLVIAILFNPIIPVHLTREIWLYIDVAVGLFLIASLFLPRGGKKYRK